jgi:hypothetical protein
VLKEYPPVFPLCSTSNLWLIATFVFLFNATIIDRDFFLQLSGSQ